MTDRQYEMNTFLKYMVSVIKQNPDQKFNEDIVYGFLKRYGLGQEDLDTGKDYGDFFGKWINEFKNVSNINVYKNPRQKKFLQFTNYRDNNGEFLKLYVSLSPDAIFDGVERIFSFIANNNIVTASKVAQSCRSDSIVLRIKNTDDAIKVIHYINSDPFFAQNARLTNPFLMRCGIVGMAYDNNLSYNSMVSYLISSYLNDMKDNNLLDNVSLEDFSNYIKNNIVSIFVKGDNLSKFMYSQYATDNFIRVDGHIDYANPDLDLVVNFMHVMNLVNNSICNEDNVNSYLNSYIESIDEEKNEMYRNRFNNMLHKFEEVYDGDEITQEIPIVNVDKTGKEVLEEFIIYGVSDKSKYNDLTMLRDSILGFCDGNEKRITRDFGFRDKFKKYINKDVLMSVTGGNLDAFIQGIIAKQNVESKYDIFVKACKNTYLNYGAAQLKGAVNSAVKGDYSKFTNSNGGYRDKMKNFTIQDINECITEFMDNYTIFFVIDIGSQVVGKLEEMLDEEKRMAI